MILCRLSHLWSIFNLMKNAHTDPFKLSNLKKIIWSIFLGKIHQEKSYYYS